MTDGLKSPYSTILVDIFLKKLIKRKIKLLNKNYFLYFLPFFYFIPLRYLWIYFLVNYCLIFGCTWYIFYLKHDSCFKITWFIIFNKNYKGRQTYDQVLLAEKLWFDHEQWTDTQWLLNNPDLSTR